jgi:hypothetical protein
MENTNKAEMHKLASRLKMSTAEVDEMVKMGSSMEYLTALEAELTPLIAKRDASAPGSKEEDDAAWAILRVVLRG